MYSQLTCKSNRKDMASEDFSKEATAMNRKEKKQFNPSSDDTFLFYSFYVAPARRFVSHICWNVAGVFACSSGFFSVTTDAEEPDVPLPRCLVIVSSYSLMMTL